MHKITIPCHFFLLTLLSPSVFFSVVHAEALPLDELRSFTEVFSRIKRDYVEEVDDKALLENAIRGMLEGLDPHSSYLDKEAYDDLQEGTSGEFGGLGIEVGMEDGFIKVISPIDDTPAARAGILSGDLIIRLDETPVKSMSLSDAIKKMRGKPDTDIELTILREGEERPVKITLTRAVIKVKSVRSRIIEPGFAYLRISNFQFHTADDLKKALKQLKADNGSALKGLILDLRNNPGGILSAAANVADSFLKQGLIVYTEGRVKDSKLKFYAKPSDLLDSAPLVVLVNAGSASAAEIVAGALQDHRRAIIMGEKTFGKGSVQTILPMNNEAALKLTTARYYTPSGRSIQAEGITPDIILQRFKLESVAGNGLSIKEKNLNRHLENDTNGDGEIKPEAEKENIEASLTRKDYALHEALNLLKGLSLSQDQKTDT